MCVMQLLIKAASWDGRFSSPSLNGITEKWARKVSLGEGICVAELRKSCCNEKLLC